MTSSTPTPKIEDQDQATPDGSGQGVWWREWLKSVVVVAVVSLLVGGITLVTNVWMGSFESLRADIRDGNARLVEEIRATDTRLSEEISQRIGEVKEEIKASNAQLREEINQRIGEVKEEVRATDTRLSEEIKASEDRVNQRIEEVKEQIRATDTRLGEEIRASEARVNQRIEEVKEEVGASEARQAQRTDELRADVKALGTDNRALGEK